MMKGRVLQLGALIALAGAAVLALYWLAQFLEVVDRTNAHDYVSDVFRVFMDDPIGVLFFQTAGSAVFLRYLPISFAFLVGLWLYDRKPRTPYLYIWSRGWWIAWTIFWGMLTWVVAAAAQANQWYAASTYVDGVRVFTGEPGEVDWITHQLTPGFIAAFLCNFAFMDIFRLRGRSGRLWEILFMLAVVSAIMFWWEYSESLNPAVYLNRIWDATKDIVMGYANASAQILFYNWVVPYKELEG